MRRMLRLFWSALALAALRLPPVGATETFLAPEQAFRLAVERTGADQFRLRWEISPGYYLYHQKVTVDAAPGGSLHGVLAGPAAVLDYLSRYTHRTVIGNERLVAIAGDKVLFRVRADDQGGKRTVAMPGEQFVGRLMQHVLPTGFKRIRHYGLRAPAAKTQPAGGSAAARDAAAKPKGARGGRGLHAPRNRHRDRLLPALQARTLAGAAAGGGRPPGAGGNHTASVSGAAVTRRRVRSTHERPAHAEPPGLSCAELACDGVCRAASPLAHSQTPPSGCTQRATARLGRRQTQPPIASARR